MPTPIPKRESETLPKHATVQNNSAPAVASVPLNPQDILAILALLRSNHQNLRDVLTRLTNQQELMHTQLTDQQQNMSNEMTLLRQTLAHISEEEERPKPSLPDVVRKSIASRARFGSANSITSCDGSPARRSVNTATTSSRSTEVRGRRFGVAQMEAVKVSGQNPQNSLYYSEVGISTSANSWHTHSPADHVVVCIDTIVKSPYFDLFCGFVILANAVFLGFESNAAAISNETPAVYKRVQNVLNGWYVVELLLRVLSQRKQFFSSVEIGWNMFDVFCVAASFVDLLIETNTMGLGSVTRLVRAFRMFRIVRTLRLGRQLRIFREFRKMVFSMISSVKTFFWSLCLLFMCVYIFAVWFTMNVADQAQRDGPHAALEKHFGDLGTSLYNLYLAISGGINWGVLVDALLEEDMILSAMLFFAFISLSIFGVLNIVTSVFVESAMQSTQHYRDLLVQEKQRQMELYMEHIKALFKSVDTDSTGAISFNELNAFLNDETLALRPYFEALELNATDAWALFKLLDKDGSGTVDIQEFCEGCLRLKGEARSFDINCMIYESRAMLAYWAGFMEYVEEKFNVVESALKQDATHRSMIATRSSHGKRASSLAADR